MEIIRLPEDLDLRQLSHALRTPLTGILGMAEALHTEPLTEIQQTYVDDIRTAGDCLLKTINQLLSESKKFNPNNQSEEPKPILKNKGLRYG